MEGDIRATGGIVQERVSGRGEKVEREFRGG